MSKILDAVIDFIRWYFGSFELLVFSKKWYNKSNERIRDFTR